MGTTFEVPDGVLGAFMGFLPKSRLGPLLAGPNENRVKRKITEVCKELNLEEIARVN